MLPCAPGSPSPRCRDRSRRASSRGGGEAAEPAASEPWTRPAGCHGDRWAEAADSRVAPRGSSGELAPSLGGRGTRATPGAAFSWQPESPEFCRLNPEDHSPLQPSEPPRPEFNPPRMALSQFIRVNYLLCLAASCPPASLRPPCPRGVFTSWFSVPCFLTIQEVPVTGPRGT